MGHLSLIGIGIVKQANALAEQLADLPEDERIEVLNQIRAALHAVSPMADHPVDFVRWVRLDDVVSNDYNPNVVAPPEMKLLARSIEADGYTMPVVTYADADRREVVDGFHRTRVARENKRINASVKGYLPVTTIRAQQTDKADRMASTIRHNRARGQHVVSNMSEIVLELSRRNWSNDKIGRELGMEPDEVLRLKQVSGLAEMFADREFSQAWEIE
jgi:ParB-like chromosome segregation protein Spo0J